MTEKSRAFLFLHISVFLFGFTAILGDLITVNFMSVVWWRALLTIAVYMIIINIAKLFRTFSTRQIMQNLFIGLLLGVHWIAFYAAIKISNATMALIAMSSSSIITALVEPLINKKVRWSAIDILFGILIIPGFMFIFYNTSQLQKTGLWIGLIAAFLGAVFSILNKKWINKGQEMKMSAIQLFSVWLLLSLLFLLFTDEKNILLQIPQGVDWFYFIVFAIVCTVLAYYLYLKSMNKLTAFDVSLGFNMEPIYGIIMAAILLHDYKSLSPMVYLGMVFTTLIVFLDLFIKIKFRRR